MDIELETREGDCVLPVQARAGASRNAIQGWHDGRLRVHVTQPAEKGKANEAIRRTLAKELALRKSQLELISGFTSREKRFLVAEITPAELWRRIQNAS